ncbi:MAG: rod shape-determining protein MreC [Fusobacterium sp.]|uniref:rod shape-determining protein MreC n=1 Tax=Fusobacterium sp. TaxID=68766 RepID=UPI0026DDC3EF|nr:rod shape-determining protein MreC [Fusobacterium sp.]MDO4691186.1 rod shape-determining protein MreC [Fusobacterium sp.]
MKRDKKIKIIATVFIILAVLTLIFNRALFKIKKYIDQSFLPIQSKIYQTAEKIGDIKNAISSYKEILEENEKLKRENMEFKLLNSINKNIEEENFRLTNLLEMKENNQIIKNLKFARVIFRDVNTINNKFYIDLGRKNGIEKNMIVIYDDFLIGRISEVFEGYSLVTMITDNSAKISVKTENNLLGISQGSDDGKNEMYFLPSTFEEGIDLGEEIRTSGISDIYPEGLRVGKINEINKAENNMFKSIKIKPEFKSRDLKEVMVYKYENNLEKKVE